MATKKKKLKNKAEVIEVSPLWDKLTNFLMHLESFNKSLTIVGVAGMISKVEREKLKKFIKSKGKNVRHSPNGGMKFKIDPEDVPAYDKLKQDLETSLTAVKITSRSLFILMVSKFDVLVSDIIKKLLYSHSDILSEEKPLTFKEAKEFKTVKDILNYFVEREVDNVMFGSHIVQIEWLEKKLKVDLKKYFPDLVPQFIELTERRNLFVHNDGVINKRYLNNCKGASDFLEEGLRNGSELTMRKAYFSDSSDCLREIAIKIIYIISQKLEPQHSEDINEAFNGLCVDFITMERYDLAYKLLDFATITSTSSNEISLRLFTINKALAKKMGGDNKTALKIINEKDWSACNNDLKMAVAIIRDDKKETLKLMKGIGKKGQIIDENVYKSDPIFRSLNKDPDFKLMYKKIYGKEYISAEERISKENIIVEDLSILKKEIEKNSQKESTPKS